MKSSTSISRSRWSGPSKRRRIPLCGSVKTTGVSKGSEGEYERSMVGYLSG